MQHVMDEALGYQSEHNDEDGGLSLALIPSVGKVWPSRVPHLILL